MARYRGPKQKIARRFNEPIFGPSKSLERKPNPPGQHGQKRRRRESEYATQLKEKQKAKHIYGVLERQFKNLFEKAARKKGVTGENLLRFLEARLDNTVFRFGFAATRRQARQMVTHRHIMVNGQVVNIPSYQLRPGDIVSIRPRSRLNRTFVENVKKHRQAFSWLEADRRTLSGKFLDFPERSDIPENIREQLIVELYSK
ncbi:MAG: 30S ribosomal protein S4 [Rhodothermaceae bacterium]|nr:30S ribosomal protein S4 [Rhodothermaceae bacterium]MXX58190.1 30S ribosomal protein S4 [Rhodothermaceae bacterium]MYD20500.1 30S ribosomal protein S4 [Rhodothermaceae bacterium]MYD55508.1 30S ribosomal protein S4 [Rhodothermaceae bacterium]MYI42412.1 30S ribosomal protein S4 [Rhodothermaceae bacterium]